MALTGLQTESLAEELLSAIPSADELQRVVQYGLCEPLASLASGQNLRELVINLIEAASARPDGIARLIVAARESHPTHPGLVAIAQEFDLAPQVLPAKELVSPLERNIDPQSRLVDLPTWLSRAGRLEAQVCRIELKGEPLGTGFLVGPDVVMTNYHVVETVIKGEVAPAELTMVLDSKQAPDGTVVNPGVRYNVSTTDWLIDCSPYNPAEWVGESNVTPALDQLDFALLRVATMPGTDAVGGTIGPPRGWIAPPATDYAFVPGDILYVIQHPLGASLKIAAGTLLGLNANATRLLYRPTTDKGSSGSPVFNREWALVALHHGGFKGHNQGIPIAAIKRLLNERGHSSAIADPDLAVAAVSVTPSKRAQSGSSGARAQNPPDDVSEDTPVELTGQQREALDEALRSAFNRPRLERLLAFRLDVSLADIAPARATYMEEVQAVIEWAVREGRLRYFVEQARDMNPGNPQLRTWADQNLAPGKRT